MAERYDTTRFGELYYASRSPSVDNLALAARHITNVLSYNQIPFAIMGGWAMYLRGGGRQTHDVDVTVETTMDYLKQILFLDTRVQIFIWTGPSFDKDCHTARDLAISADIVICGYLGAPLDLRNSCEYINTALSTPQGDSAIVLGLASQLNAKFGAFVQRGATNDNDFRDLVFLLTAYHAQIPAILDQLNLDQRKAFVQEYENLYAANATVIAAMKQLLGL